MWSLHGKQMVLTKLDNGSATLAGLPAVQLDRLQSVLNAAARLIYQRRKFDHVSPLLKELHWLRVPERITFRLAVLTYRCQHNTHHVTSPPSSNRRAMLVTGSAYAHSCRPSSMFLAPNTWPSVAVRSVQLQLMRRTVYQRQCSRLSHWTFFVAASKLKCSSVLTTDIVPVKQLYCCVTHFHFPAAFCCGCSLEVYRL